MQTTPAGRRTLFQVFRGPLIPAAVATWGLVAALLTEGPLDLLWSSMVALPVVIILVNVFRR